MFELLAQTGLPSDPYTLIMKWGLPPALLIAIPVLWKTIGKLYRERTNAEKDKLKIEKEKVQLALDQNKALDDARDNYRRALEAEHETCRVQIEALRSENQGLREQHARELMQTEKERRDYTIRVEKERREQAMALLREQRELVEKNGQAMLEMMQTIQTLSGGQGQGN